MHEAGESGGGKQWSQLYSNINIKMLKKRKIYKNEPVVIKLKKTTITAISMTNKQQLINVERE